MDITQLKYFVALSRSLNFSDVASRFYVTQPTVSRQIKVLEETLGIKLFYRDKHNVSLSTSGEAFYRYAVQIIELSELAETRLRQIEIGTEGFLRLFGVSSMAQTMSAYLCIFSEQYPNILTELECGNGMQQMTAIEHKRSDLYFSFASLLENTGHLTMSPLRPDRFCLFAHEKYAALEPFRVDFEDSPDSPKNDSPAGIDAKKLSQLKNLPLLVYDHSAGPYLTRRVFSLCEENRFNPKRVLYYTSFLSMVIAINAGVGFSILPERMKDFFPPTHISIPIESAHALIENALGYDPNTNNHAVMKFLDIVREYPDL